jgi:hypothetical protein
MKKHKNIDPDIDDLVDLINLTENKICLRGSQESKLWIARLLTLGRKHSYVR